MPGRPTTRAAIIAAIERDGPMPAAELTRIIGKPRGTISSALNCARRRPGLLSIVGWQRCSVTSGRHAPIYGLGPAADAPRPRKLSNKEKSATYRERWRALIRQRQRARRGSRLAAPTWMGVL